MQAGKVLPFCMHEAGIPAWFQKKGIEERAHALEQGLIRDPRTLARIARTEQVGYIRALATERLYDQTVLKSILSTDLSWVVRVAAVKNLTDESLLASLQSTDAHELVRSAAQIRLAALQKA